MASTIRSREPWVGYVGVVLLVACASQPGTVSPRQPGSAMTDAPQIAEGLVIGHARSPITRSQAASERGTRKDVLRGRRIPGGRSRSNQANQRGRSAPIATRVEAAVDSRTPNMLISVDWLAPYWCPSRRLASGGSERTRPATTRTARGAASQIAALDTTHAAMASQKAST